MNWICSGMWTVRFLFFTQVKNPAILTATFMGSLTTKEILGLRRCNSDLIETFIGVERFEDVLEHMKGKAVLNLDRCIDILDSMVRSSRAVGNERSDSAEKRPVRSFFKENRGLCTGLCVHAYFYGRRRDQTRLKP